MSPRFDYGKTKPWIHKLGDGDRGRCGPKCRGAPWPRAAARARLPCERRVLDPRGRAHRIRVELAPVVGGDARADRPVRDGRADRRVVARVGRSLHLRRSLGRGGRALADHTEGADVRPDRRDRRGGDDVVAGVPRRRAQLGLPVLLAPRRGAHTGRADDRQLRRRGDELARLGGPRRRRRPRGHPDHVRARGRAPARRVRAAAPRRVRGFGAGAGRQRRLRAAAARRLRRADRRDLPGA